MTVLRGRLGHARVVVLTVIADEFEAVKTALGADQEIGTTGVFAPSGVASHSANVIYPFVVARCSDRSNTPASENTTWLLENYRPEVLLLVGIAGGIQRNRNPGEGRVELEGPSVGDVVVGRYVHYAAYTKNLPEGRSLRYFPIDQPASNLVSEHAETLAIDMRRDAWADAGLDVVRPDGIGFPRVHVGEIVAVEAIAGNPSAQEQIDMLRRFDNADAVDMESMGVGRALHSSRRDVHYSPRWLCIRGISDIVTADDPSAKALIGDGSTESSSQELTPPVKPANIDNNKERQLWKSYASAVAAVFARRVVERILSQARPYCGADDGAEAWVFPSVQVVPEVTPANPMSDPEGML